MVNASEWEYVDDILLLEDVEEGEEEGYGIRERLLLRVKDTPICCCVEDVPVAALVICLVDCGGVALGVV